MDASELANKLRNNPNNESSYIEDVIKWCDENAEKLNLSNPDETFLCEKATKYLMENKGNRTWSKDDAKYIIIFLAKKTLKGLNLDQATGIQIINEDEYEKMYGNNDNIIRGVCILQEDEFSTIVYSPYVIKDLTSENKAKFLKGLQTIYHEIRHVQQNKSINRETKEDGTKLPMSKERYLSALETLSKKQDPKFYRKNYQHLLKENDAEKYGLIKAYATIKNYSVDLLNKYNGKKKEEMMQQYDRNYYEALSSINENGRISLKEEIETKAGIYIMDHPEVLQKFPILNIAFNKDGSKRDIIELLEGRNKLLENNQNTEMINELYKMIINNRNPSHGGLKGTKDELLKIEKYIQETGTEDEFIYDLVRYKLEHKTKMTQEQIDSMMEILHSEAAKSRQDKGNLFMTKNNVSISILGKQVLEEMSDTQLIDETENEMKSQELKLEQQSSLEQVDVSKIDLNNSYFHFTKRDNLGRISREGLKPQIGDASKLKNEEHSRVYLSRGGKGIIEIKNSFIHEFKKLRVCDIPEEYIMYFDIKDYSSQEQVNEKAVYDAMEKRFKDEIYFKVNAKEGEDFLIEDQYNDAFLKDFSKESLREMLEKNPKKDIKGKVNHTISPEQLTMLRTEKGDTAFDIVKYLYNRLLENAKKEGKEESVKFSNSDLNSFFEYIKQREINEEERI